MSRPMKILGQEILPGSSHVLKMDLAKLYTRTDLEIPIIVKRAKKDGPCLLLTAGIHGDETNGVEIVRQIIANKYNIPKAGTIICVPLLNVFGFINHSREFPDGRDLNRMFPGSKTGSLASRFAHKFITQVASQADVCIDFHTGGKMRFNYSHLRIGKGDDELLELAKVFESKFIMFAEQRESSFRHEMSKMGKKILLFEGGKSLSLDRAVTRQGVAGTIRIMKHLGINDHTHILNPDKAREPILLENASWVRADHSGIYRSFIKVGDVVHKGDELGSVTDPFGLFTKTIKSKLDGYVLNNNHMPLVNQGDALINIGLL